MTIAPCALRSRPRCRLCSYSPSPQRRAVSTSRRRCRDSRYSSGGGRARFCRVRIPGTCARCAPQPRCCYSAWRCLPRRLSYSALIPGAAAPSLPFMLQSHSPACQLRQFWRSAPGPRRASMPSTLNGRCFLPIARCSSGLHHKYTGALTLGRIWRRSHVPLSAMQPEDRLFCSRRMRLRARSSICMQGHP